MDKPYSPSEISSNYQRDWPDARGVWLNDDQKIGVYLNRKDHLLVSVIDSTNDFQKVFEQFSSFITEVNHAIHMEKF